MLCLQTWQSTNSIFAARAGDAIHYDPGDISDAHEHRGNLQIRGRNNAKVHIGIYSPLCFGSPDCDPDHPGVDPAALVLPFRLFVSQEVAQLILDSVSRQP